MPDFIPVDTTEDRPREAHLACPECGCTETHPKSLDCWSPGTENGHVGITNSGITRSPRVANKGSNGVRICLGFLCESGHVFEYYFTFSHGTTTVEKSSGDCPGWPAAPATIWRD